MKTCSRCKSPKPLLEYAKNKRKKDGYQDFCRECNTAYQREHYKRNKKTYAQRASAYKRKNREWIKELKDSLVCERCGQSHPATLDFHHSDSSQKEFSIATMRSHSIENIKIEIEKCEVLCANCHRIHHYEEQLAHSSIG